MLKAFSVPIARSGLPADYLALPDEPQKHKYEIIEKAYKWAFKIYKEEYSAWLDVWKQEPPPIWVKRGLLGGFREVRVLNDLGHKVRVQLTRRTTRPQLLKKGYKKQHERHQEKTKDTGSKCDS